METALDFYSVRFWLVVFLAIVLLQPLTNAKVRSWALALINLGVLALLLKSAVIVVLVGIILAWLWLKLCQYRLGRLPVLLGFLLLLGLFLLHKLPEIGTKLGTAPLNSILTAVGFSYVALRLWDVTVAVRDGRHAAPALVYAINYLLPFHMLSAGPIQSYDEFVDQPLVPPALTFSQSLQSVERIASGLFKKYILADYIQLSYLTGLRTHGWYLLLEVHLSFLWLYLDFRAYTDVAVGIGGLLGVATPENFRRPYFARNLIAFWERWHISLSQFIRRNWFIPIQVALMRRSGGRGPLRAASVAFTVAFLACGLWHGVSWPWLAWGVFQAAGLIVCNLYKASLQKRLGRKGVSSYMADWRIRVAATLLTIEYQTLAFAVVTYPYGERFSWNLHSI